MPWLSALAALLVGCGAAPHGEAELAQASTEDGARCALEPSQAAAAPALPSAGAQLAPRFVYATNQNSHDVSAYAVEATGELKSLGSPVTVGRYPGAIALNPSGNSLFVANRGSSSLSVFSIDAKSGELRANGPEVDNASAPVAIVAHPGGQLVFVGNDDAWSPNTVTTYAVDAAEQLVPVAVSETGGSGLLALALDRSGQFLYTVNALSDSVSAFQLDTCSGGFKQVNEVEAPFPVAVSLGASGERLYVASNGPEPAILTFGIDLQTGALNPIASLTGIFQPWSLRALRLDASGEFLVLVALGADNAAFVSTLPLDASGAPRSTPASSVAAGENAVGVATAPSGRFAYVSNFGSNDISSYALDPSNGRVTPLGAVAAGSSPSALAIATAAVR